MSRRRLLYCVSTVVLLMAAWLIFRWWTTGNVRITRENFDRIELGMTLAEVEAVLGGPPGDYRWGRPIAYIGHDWGEPFVEARPTAPSDPAWWGTEGAVRLYVSPDGRVGGKDFCDAFERSQPQATFWQRLRSLVGL